jgi:hypothetical protein
MLQKYRPLPHSKALLLEFYEHHPRPRHLGTSLTKLGRVQVAAGEGAHRPEFESHQQDLRAMPRVPHLVRVSWTLCPTSCQAVAPSLWVQFEAPGESCLQAEVGKREQSDIKVKGLQENA